MSSWEEIEILERERLLKLIDDESKGMPHGRSENGYYILENVKVGFDSSGSYTGLSKIVQESSAHSNPIEIFDPMDESYITHANSMFGLINFRPKKGDILTIRVKEMQGTDAREVAERIYSAFVNPDFTPSKPINIQKKPDYTRTYNGEPKT